MIKVGLTGGIGSGKTMVCEIFKLLDIPVFHADDEAKKFLQSPNVIQELTNIFGKDIIDHTGTINKKALAKIVFNDHKALETLNGIIHPLVSKQFDKWCIHYANHEYIIQEAAILFESGFYKKFDIVITVSAPIELRLKRVAKRDQSPVQEIKKRMDKQWAENKRNRFADHMITNDNENLVIPQVLGIHQNILKKLADQ
jgi:dephospho-CoA kinase